MYDIIDCMWCCINVYMYHILRILTVDLCIRYAYIHSLHTMINPFHFVRTLNVQAQTFELGVDIRKIVIIITISTVITTAIIELERGRSNHQVRDVATPGSASCRTARARAHVDPRLNRLRVSFVCFRDCPQSERPREMPETITLPLPRHILIRHRHHGCYHRHHGRTNN